MIVLNINTPIDINIFEYTICYCSVDKLAKGIGDWFLTIFKFCNENPYNDIVLCIHEKLLDIAYLFSDRIKYVITYNLNDYNNVNNLFNRLIALNSNFIRTSYIEMLEKASLKFKYKCTIDKKFVKNLDLIESIPNNSIICFPETSGNNILNNSFFEPILEKFYNTNTKIYTNSVKNHPNYLNQIVLKNTEPITIDIYDLVYLCYTKNILIIGNRCGILDLLYFSCPSANIINLVQSYLSDLQRYNFFDNDLYNNSNISHLKHTNGLDVLVENYDTKLINSTTDFISSILKLDKPLKQSNNILIHYNDDTCISNYFDYIKKIFKSIEFSKDIIISSCEYSFKKNKNAIHIWINIEHTIVKPNGRSTDSNCELLNDYLIRIDNYENYISNDYIIEYSNPNIVHTNKSSNKNIHNKQIYIPPMIYDFNPYNKDRKLEILTTFLDINQERRKRLLTNLYNVNLPVKNINSFFDLENNFNLLQNTKILVNIHQTEEHHTFEELRCLPALLNGVIVISEDSPYKEHIPYNKYIIWTSYENIIQTVVDVLNNYEEYYNKIFIDSNIKNDIDLMKDSIINSIKEKIL
jgi:hypothetical protein